MSAEEWVEKRDNEFGTEWTEDISDLAYALNEYANYVAQWHLNSAKDFLAKNSLAKIKTDCLDNLHEVVVDKQSIHTAIDNYIEINLNKEL